MSKIRQIFCLLVLSLQIYQTSSDDTAFYRYLQSLGYQDAVQNQFVTSETDQQVYNTTVNPYQSDFMVRVHYNSVLGCDDPQALFCDRDALFDFKTKMSKEAQQMLTSWTGSDPCDGKWKGIQCGQVSPGIYRVVQIQLGKFYYTKNTESNQWLKAFNAQHVFNMNCKVSDDIGNKMKFLEVLNVMGCHINGISDSLANLRGMKVFSFANNQLRDEQNQQIYLPSWMANWKDVSVADFENTQLQGSLPSEFSSWTRIEVANFYYNHLTGSVPVEYSLWVQNSQTHPHLHYFLVGSVEAPSQLCILPQTKSIFDTAVVMGGTDVTSLPLCAQRDNQKQTMHFDAVQKVINK
eukprot:TRINITY_DN28329_c3_g1_i2.p1 TRINITY_DN28329_c3_g1~~TRINITY_DN28329_c3_g1_i2.p1  ORF type:complete len:350 (-),score=21.94 TRINITY_DN28329_c3_g1_i2:155-1204(-)